MTLSLLDIARVCHEANRALQIIAADPAVPISPPWDDAPKEQKASCIVRIFNVAANAELTLEEFHMAWMRIKIKQGWEYGPIKDKECKLHPCLVPYGDFSAEHKLKEVLFRTIVLALVPNVRSMEITDMSAALHQCEQGAVDQ